MFLFPARCTLVAVKFLKCRSFSPLPSTPWSCAHLFFLSFPFVEGPSLFEAFCGYIIRRSTHGPFLHNHHLVLRRASLFIVVILSKPGSSFSDRSQFPLVRAGLRFSVLLSFGAVVTEVTGRASLFFFVAFSEAGSSSWAYSLCLLFVLNHAWSFVRPGGYEIGPRGCGEIALSSLFRHLTVIPI